MDTRVMGSNAPMPPLRSSRANRPTSSHCDDTAAVPAPAAAAAAVMEATIAASSSDAMFQHTPDPSWDMLTNSCRSAAAELAVAAVSPEAAASPSSVNAISTPGSMSGPTQLKRLSAYRSTSFFKTTTLQPAVRLLVLAGDKPAPGPLSMHRNCHWWCSTQLRPYTRMCPSLQPTATSDGVRNSRVSGMHFSASVARSG